MIPRLLRRSLIYPVLGFSLFLLCSSAYAAGNEANELTLNERVYVASRVYAALANSAHMQGVPDQDIEAAYRAYLDKAIAAENRKAFTLAGMEFLASFHNGHTLYGDFSLFTQDIRIPFIAKWINGQWVVSESWTPDLKLGDVIEKIDDRTFEQFYQEKRRYISASTEANARNQLFSREPKSPFMPAFAPYAHLFPEKFVLTLAGGRKISVDRGTIQTPPLAGTEGRWLQPDKVAYIRIPSLFSPEYEQRAVELVREFQHASLLIVDMRGNDGGSTPETLMPLLMDRPYRFWTEATPLNMPYFRFRAQSDWRYEAFRQPMLSWPSAILKPANDNFTGKVAILVDAGCFSACEDFVAPFKDNHRALIVGENTGGSTGQPYMVDLGKGIIALIGAKRASFADGTQFEGVGIKPDVEVHLTADDIAHGKDPVLATALQQAAN